MTVSDCEVVRTEFHGCLSGGGLAVQVAGIRFFLLTPATDLLTTAVAGWGQCNCKTARSVPLGGKERKSPN